MNGLSGMGVRPALLIRQEASRLIALAALIVGALTPWRMAGLVLIAAGLVAIMFRARESGFAALMTSQLMLMFAAIAVYRPGPDDRLDVPFALAGTGIALLIAGIPILNTVTNQSGFRAAHLPGYVETPLTPVSPSVLLGANVVLLAAFAATAGWSDDTRAATAWPVAILVSAVCAADLVICAGSLARRRATGAREQRFRSAMEEYDPAFVLYFSAPDNTEYHVTMWLPYLQRIGTHMIVLVRELQSYLTLSEIVDVPVIYAPAVAAVDLTVTPGMHACFYVNNGAKNAHMVRFAGMTHVQLLHGDSDKASSANPVTAMFDRVFVAGEAAIDRYAANGVHIPRSKFDIVGRPQVETIEVTHDRIADITTKTVLYATTWTGLYTDANYCSLAIGEKIVAELLRRKATIIARPHPYTGRSAELARHVARINAMLAEDREKTGRAHVFGHAATTGMTLVECANRADVLVSDVSGVASDFLYSAKPFALTNMADVPDEAFAEEFPLARAAYIIDRHAANIEEICGQLLEDDYLAETRLEVKQYYLGGFDEASYADAFVSVARRYVLGAGGRRSLDVLAAAPAADVTAIPAT